MDKLLDLVQKLRDSVVPAEKLSKLNKKQIISFIEDAKLLDKMRIFHDKTKAKAMKSIVNDEEEEGVVPDSSDLKKMSVSKLRKLLRDFHRDIGLKQKHSKMSASKLRSFVSRNRYQEMLYGDDDMKFLMMGEDEKEPKTKKTKASKKERGEGRERVQTSKTEAGQSIVNVYTGKEGAAKEACGCDEVNILEEVDTQGIIMKLAPELYRSLMAKSYLLDLCNLNRMRREHEVCAVACDPKSYNRWACCEKPCCPGQGTVVAKRDPGMVEVREGASLGDISTFEDGGQGLGVGRGRGRGTGPTPFPGGGGGGGGGGGRGGRTPFTPTPFPPHPHPRTPFPPTPHPPHFGSGRGRGTGPRTRTLIPRTTQSSIPVPERVVSLTTKVTDLENITNHIPTMDDVKSYVSNNVNISNQIQDYEDERDNIRDKVDDLINNISNMDDEVINQNIIDLLDRVDNINTVRNSINDQVTNVVKNTNINREDVQNYITQTDLIRNSQTENDRNTVNNRTSNIVNINQQLQNLTQELLNKLTKSLLLKSQNKDSENTRRNIRELKDKIRKLNRVLNRQINNPESELRNTLVQNQAEINKLTQSQADGEIKPEVADRMRNRLSNENTKIRAQMARENIPEVDYDTQLAAQINFMKNQVPQLAQAGKTEESEAAKLKLIDLLKEQHRSQINAIRE